MEDKQKERLPKDTNKLFDVVLVVELQQGNDGKNVPFISYRYPSLFSTDPFTASVTQFCFPDINQFPTETMEKLVVFSSQEFIVPLLDTNKSNSETFSFVLTEGDGERRFGYCTRCLPSGTGPRYPIAYSIMTYFPCFPLYTKILAEVGYRYENISMKDLTQLVESIWQRPFPAPAESFEIKVLGEATYFTRPRETGSQLEHLELKDILCSLDDRNILIVFISLLLERRIIFCATKLSTLSSCIQAAVALVYPFTWQHIYIPVLPKSLLSFVCAPMPFVVGILRSELNEVLSLPMDEVLIIDVDKNEFIRTPAESETEDLNLIPVNFVSQLRRTVRNSAKAVKKQQKRKKESKIDDMQQKHLDYQMHLLKEELSDTFIQFFVIVLTGYRDFLSTDSVLDKTGFIESQPHELQPLIKAMTGAQMFECFLEERRSGIADTTFEQRIDQNEKLSEKLLASGIGEDMVDSLVPHFGLDKEKRLNPRPVSKKGSNLMSTLFSQFKISPASSEENLHAHDTKVLSVSDVISHTGPQFVLPTLNSQQITNSCPTSPIHSKQPPKAPPRHSMETIDLSPIVLTIDRSKLTKSCNLPNPSLRFPAGTTTTFKANSTSSLELEKPKTRSRRALAHAPNPITIAKANSALELSLQSQKTPKSPKKSTPTGKPISECSPRNLPRPPQKKKRPLSQELDIPKKDNIKQFSRDAESIPRPLPAPGTRVTGQNLNKSLEIPRTPAVVPPRGSVRGIGIQTRGRGIGHTPNRGTRGSGPRPARGTGNRGSSSRGGRGDANIRGIANRGRGGLEPNRGVSARGGNRGNRGTKELATRGANKNLERGNPRSMISPRSRGRPLPSTT